MDTLDTRTLIIGIVAVLALLAVVAWFFGRRKQSYRLAQRFGPEYGHTVDALGSRSKAETELKTRESRVGGLHIVALTNTDAGRFSQAWGDLQARFVDNPKGVVIQADQLVRELMAKRGYPVADFERRAADISVDHPAVVENYRAAQAIALRDQQGQLTVGGPADEAIRLRELDAGVGDAGASDDRRGQRQGSDTHACHCASEPLALSYHSSCGDHCPHAKHWVSSQR